MGREKLVAREHHSGEYRANPRANSLGFVYVILDGRKQFLKVGFTSRPRPEDRVRDLQTSTPDRLSLIDWIYSVKMIEHAIHRRLGYIEKALVHGEWYRIKNEVLDVLKDYGFRSDEMSKLRTLTECEAPSD